MKLRLHVSLTSVHDSDATEEVEIPDEAWHAMSEGEQEEEAQFYLETHAANNVDSWWEEVR